MPAYPGDETSVRVPIPVLLNAARATLSATGMPGDHAGLLAGCLVHADRRGVHSHGLAHLEYYVRLLLSGGVDPGGRPRLTADTGAALKVDGGNSIGHIGMAFAMQQAITRARQTGVALAAVGNSNHCGALYYFAAMAADHDMIGLCSTNAMPTMAPVGGRDRVVGLSPLSIAIRGKRHRFLLDTSFGESARGKIAIYAQRGYALPPGWATDAAGRPTTDASAALEGLIQPIGRHKGIGLGMAMGMIASLLSDAAYGSELGDLVHGALAGRDGHFCMAMNIAAFAPVEVVRARVDAILMEARNVRRIEGCDRVYTPGELGDELEARSASEGVPLHGEQIAGMLRAAQAAGADVAALLPFAAAAAQGR